MKEIVIYTPAITPRFTYACKILFEIVLNCKYKLLAQKEEGILINYSNDVIEGAIQIIPSGLLEQEGINSHDVAIGDFQKSKTLFHSGKGDIPFDIFSAVFYMCSRYEEYLPHEADEHGRFKVEDSLAYRNDFVQEPIVEQWALLLSKQMKLELPTGQFNYQLTIDIDQAWKYLHNSFIRTVGGTLKNLVKLELATFAERLLVLSGLKKDPWDTYSYLEGLEDKTGKPHQFFALMSSYRPYDAAIPFKKKAFGKLIRSLEKRNKVGIHPSYISHEDTDQLAHEFVALSKIVRNKPRRSRQHYLKMSLPETYRKIIRLGVIEDYSMGWSGQMGFRAGISRAFPFYDLPQEKESHLTIVPFVYMDRTLKDYMALSPEAALIQVKEVIDKLKAVGGQFVMLWHNDSISDKGEWKEWRRVLEESIEYCKK